MKTFAVLMICLLSVIDGHAQPVTKTIEPFYYNKQFILWACIVAAVMILMLISSKYLNKKFKNNKQ
jgi:hypothetical protein